MKFVQAAFGTSRSWIALLVLVVQPAAAHAETRVALVCSGNGAPVDAVLQLAVADLSNDGGLALLERQEVDRLLAEQKLSLVGVVDAGTAIAAGRILDAEMFAVVESDVETQSPIGAVIFDAKSGVRLCDQSFAGKQPDETARELARLVRQALEKHRARGDAQAPICVLTVRNADLPREFDGLCDACGALLQRRLAQHPQIALLEREHLEHFNKERALAAKAASKPLPSAVLLEIDVGKAEQGNGLAASARLTNSDGKAVGVVKVTSKQPNAVELATALDVAVVKQLNQPLGESRLDTEREGRRFLNEALSALQQERFRRALSAAEAARALVPKDVDAEATLAMCLSRAFFNVAAPDVDAGQIHHKTRTEDELELALNWAIRSVRLRLAAAERARASADEDLVAKDGRQFEGNPHWYHAFNEGFRYFNTQAQSRSSARLEELRDVFRSEWLAYLNQRARDGMPYVAANDRIWSLVSRSHKDYMDHKLARLEQWVDQLLRNRERLNYYSAMEGFAYRSSYDVTNTPRRWQPTPGQRSRLDQFIEELPARDEHPAFLFGALMAYSFRLRFSEERLRDGYLDEVQDLRRRILDRLELPELENRDTQAHLARAQTYDGYFKTLNWWWTGESVEQQFHAAQAAYDKMIACNECCLRVLSPRLETAAEELLPAVLRRLDEFRKCCERPDFVVLGYVSHPELGRQRFIEEIARIRAIVLERRPDLGKFTRWAAARKLIDVSDFNAMWLGWPLIQEDELLALTVTEGATRELKLIRTTLSGEKPKLVGSIRYQNKSIGSGFVSGVCRGPKCVYASTRGEGVVVFPLDGGSASLLDRDDGLISEQVYSIAFFGGKLYLGVADFGNDIFVAGRDTYLLSYDVRTKAVDVIASSRRTQPRSPFDGEGPFVFEGITADHPRKRLLMLIRPLSLPGKSRDSTGRADFDQRAGIWEYVPESRRFRQLSSFGSKSLANGRTADLLHHWSGVVRQDHLLVGDDWLQTLELTTNKIHWIYGRMRSSADVRRNAVKTNTLYRGEFAFEDGYFWTHEPLGRIAVASQQQELFERPQSLTRAPPDACRVLRLLGDGTELLYGDGKALWVLTVPSPAAQGDVTKSQPE